MDSLPQMFADYMTSIHLKRCHWLNLEFDGYVLHILHPEKTDLLLEAKRKGISIGGIYSARVDKVPSPGKMHIHVYNKNNEIFALNFDGTSHDKSHGVKIPNVVMKCLSDRFPQFKLPENGIIESMGMHFNNIVGQQLLLG